MTSSAGRRRRAPEVVQSSPVDCGPAVLASFLALHGIQVPVERLRDLLGTDVDGTSTSALRRVARSFGLDARQFHVPRGHLVDASRTLLPAVVVTRREDGANHFVLCERLGPRGFDVMDPAIGRTRVAAELFLRDVVEIAHAVAAHEWRAWAGSPGYAEPLRERLVRLVSRRSAAEELLELARADATWVGFAALTAAIAATETLVERGAVRRGDEAASTLRVFARSAATDARSERPAVDREFWPVGFAGVDDGEELLLVRGAVVLGATGRVEPSEDAREPATSEPSHDVGRAAERVRGPLARIASVVREDARGAAVLALLALFGAAAAVFVQALLLRALLDVGTRLPLPETRTVAVLALALFAVLAATLDGAIAFQLARVGRRLEDAAADDVRGRVAQLSDRFFASRPGSDVAERAHSSDSSARCRTNSVQVLRATFEARPHDRGHHVDRPGRRADGDRRRRHLAGPVALRTPRDPGARHARADARRRVGALPPRRVARDRAAARCTERSAPSPASTSVARAVAQSESRSRARM
ncbi:MAG: cysteine peptidase family C39 domain-containing protein [Planctomycetota bacterium]